MVFFYSQLCEDESMGFGSIYQQLVEQDLSNSFVLFYFSGCFVSDKDDLFGEFDGKDSSLPTIDIKIESENFPNGILDPDDPRCDSDYWILKTLANLPDNRIENIEGTIGGGGKFQLNSILQGIQEIETSQSKKGILCFYDMVDFDGNPKEIKVNLNNLTQKELNEIKGVDKERNKSFIERYSI